MAPIIAKPLLSDLVAQSGKVPSSHIRPVGDRPDLANVDNVSGAGIPLIDLTKLDGPERHEVVRAIGEACESDGFFMVTNHGIPDEVVEGMLRVAREFFHLPESERLKCYSDDPKKAIRLSTSFNVRTEKVSNWRDFLRLHCYPLESFIDQWPSNPPSFRQVVGTYSKEARALALRLLEAISESLGLERSYMVTAMGRHAQHMAVNYYPPCPQPELTYGLPGHKDPNVVTLLLQDGVSGLQVQRNGRWVAANPVPNALVINIGDQLQALSNDRYKTVLHRVIVNSKSERISVLTLYCPSPDAVIAPAEALVDDGHPLAYRPFTYQECYDEFWNMGLQSAPGPSAPVNVVKFEAPVADEYQGETDDEWLTAQLILPPQQAVFEKPEESAHRHIKPLYLQGYVDDKPMSKILVDGGATVNLMPYSTYRKLGKTEEDLIKTNMILKDFGGNPSEPKGVLNVKLTVGSKTLPTTFFIIDGKGSYSLLLGRDWIHANCCIPSTMHQSLIQWTNGDYVEIVPADKTINVAVADFPLWESDRIQCLSGQAWEADFLKITDQGFELISKASPQ